MDNNYLSHHGIKGQKWGVRRYQKKDGSLTPAGKKRLAKLESEKKMLDSIQKESESKIEKKENTNPLSSMPTEELRNIVQRMTLESQYNNLSKQLNDPNRELRTKKEQLELQRDYNKLVAEANKKGETFVQKYTKQLADSLAKEVGSAIASEGKKAVQTWLNQLAAKK